MDAPDAPHRSTPDELRARLAAEHRRRPFLLLRDGDGVQRIVDLGAEDGRLTLGRSTSNAVVLRWDGEVSRVHATLERLGDEWTLTDDGRSRNGTYLEGERIRGRARLRDGDVIRLGATLVVFRNPMGAESLPTVASQRPAVPDVTPGQFRVLAALCRPCAAGDLAAPATNQQIAAELFVSVDTVKTHMRALFDAFDLGDLPPSHKRITLARRALELGLVSPRDA